LRAVLSDQWLQFRFALQFLTRLPVGRTGVASARQWAGTLLWYPLVGLIIGLVLSLLLLSMGLYLSASVPPFMAAAIVLAVWVGLTGALHLDGLADCADAWVGGQGDSQRTLEIMKDPRAGPMAVVAIVLVLLLKLAALTVLIESGQWRVLWIAPVFARAALLAAFLFMPYISKQGLGSAIAENLPQNSARLVLAISAILPVLVLPGGVWIPCVISAAVVFYGWRMAFLSRLGGFTGDCAGVLVELLETVLLIVLVFVVGAESFGAVS